MRPRTQFAGADFFKLFCCVSCTHIYKIINVHITALFYLTFIRAGGIIVLFFFGIGYGRSKGEK